MSGRQPQVLDKQGRAKSRAGCTRALLCAPAPVRAHAPQTRSCPHSCVLSRAGAHTCAGAHRCLPDMHRVAYTGTGVHAHRDADVPMMRVSPLSAPASPPTGFITRQAAGEPGSRAAGHLGGRAARQPGRPGGQAARQNSQEPKLLDYLNEAPKSVQRHLRKTRTAVPPFWIRMSPVYLLPNQNAICFLLSLVLQQCHSN